MGWIYKRKGKLYSSWYIGYRVNNKVHLERVVRCDAVNSHRIAEKVLAKRTTEIAEGKFLDKKIQKLTTWEELVDLYMRLYAKVKKKSWHNDEDSIKRLGRDFSGKYIQQITPFMIDRFKMQRIKEVAPATVDRNLACLKCMFNQAIRWDLIESNPVSRVALFRPNNQRTRYLEKEEIKKMLSKCNGYLKSIVIIALNTGMRKSEILSLKWRENIDFKNSLIYLYNTKNKETRAVPMNSEVRAEFVKTKKHPESAYVFCNKEGKPYADIKKSFLTALKKAGIINFRFHDLRHTFASHLVMSGVDLNTVRELLGHKSLQMTLRYSHLSRDHKQRAVNLLNFTDKTGSAIHFTIQEQNQKNQEFVTNELAIR